MLQFSAGAAFFCNCLSPWKVWLRQNPILFFADLKASEYQVKKLPLDSTFHLSVLTPLQNFTWFWCTYFMARYFKGLFESCFIHFQKPFAKHFLLIFLSDHVWLPFEDQSSTTFLLDSKVIYPKYSCNKILQL